MMEHTDANYERLGSDSFQNYQSGDETYYREWFALYYELSTLPLDSEAVRHSPTVIARLHSLGWKTSPQMLDAYWHRVSWISSHCYGRVCEIGCGMGNVTRWIAANPAVESVLGLDVLETYIAALRSFSWPKVTAFCYDVSLGGERIAPYAPFDTVVLAELIEHLSFKQEIAIVNAVRPYLSSKAIWIVSTPIGFMPDPDHKRGFTPFVFRCYTRLLYGQIIFRADNKIQQYVVCRAKPESALIQRARVALARVLDIVFVIKPTTMHRMPLSLLGKVSRIGTPLRKF